MRVALAVVSLLVLIVGGSGGLRPVPEPLAGRLRRHTSSRRWRTRRRRQNAPRWKAARPASSRPSSTFVRRHERIDRCQSCHIAVDDPRFTTANEPLRTHPYSAAMGDVFRNGRWERRHKFTDFGCTTCHDGPGPRIGKARRARRRPLLAVADARLHHPERLEERNCVAPARQGFHPGQLRAVPHRQGLCWHPVGHARARAVLQDGLLRLPSDRGPLDGNARPRSDRSRQGAQARLPVGTHRESARLHADVDHAEVQAERRRHARRW